MTMARLLIGIEINHSAAYKNGKISPILENLLSLL
jgi:hypothetical protein